MSFAAAEADRRISNVIQIGTITAINAGAASATVQIGDLDTAEIPVAQFRAGGMSLWWMPQVGEQVVVACPSGDVARAVVLASIFKGNAPSANAGEPMIELGGAKMVVNGTLEVTGDVIANGVSLIHHTHGGVAAGMSNTGEPN